MFPLLLLAGAGVLFWMTTMKAAPLDASQRAEQIQAIMAEQDRMMGVDPDFFQDFGTPQQDRQRAEFWEATGEIGSSGDFSSPVDDFYGEAAGEI